MFVPGSERVTRLSKGIAWAEVMFTFRCEGTPGATCSGFLNLIPEIDGVWRIWMIRTILEQLNGYGNVDELQPEQSLSDKVNEVNGHAQTVNTQVNASTMDGTNQTGAATHFDVVIIGAGQAGLGTAGRLQALGVPYIVLD